jgi:sulfur carrier protein ThiS
MRVTFKLYAMLSDYLPDAACKTNALELDIPPGCTVGQVIDEHNLPPKLVHLVLVNGNYIQPAERAGRALNEGDVLAIWPPIAGG